MRSVNMVSLVIEKILFSSSLWFTVSYVDLSAAYDTVNHKLLLLLLLVVSLHFSHPLFDTFLCRFIVMYQIYI